MADDPTAVEMLVHDVWRDARLLCLVPADSLAAARAEIEEARECLNDALAKIDRLIRVAA